MYAPLEMRGKMRPVARNMQIETVNKFGEKLFLNWCSSAPILYVVVHRYRSFLGKFIYVASPPPDFPRLMQLGVD